MRLQCRSAVIRDSLLRSSIYTTIDYAATDSRRPGHVATPSLATRWRPQGNRQMKKSTIAFTLALGLALFGAPAAFATVTVTAAAGGSAIPADTTGGSYTALTGPTIAEGTSGEIGAGSIVLNPPAGFIFNTNVSVTVSVTKVTVASATASVTTNSVTITVTAPSGSGKGSIAWSGIQVRPAAGSPLAGGNITRSGTSSFTASTSNYGT